jgi:soluble lytic murein transglycosylase-like protein
MSVPAVAVLVALAGCGLLRPDDSATPTLAGDGTAASTEVTAEPTPEQTTPEPTESPTPTKKPKPAKATPTQDPNNFQLPECAHREGRLVSKAKAKAALISAANRQYWRTEAPKLRVPFKLVKAVAWNESGWQSNIVNCDTGKGLMQVLPATRDHVNLRFGLAYDIDDYRDNAFIGANFLAYLTKEFGNAYFKGSHDLSTAKCKSHTDRCLLNVVISAYNFGETAVRDIVKNKRALPNPQYVDTVRSLMKKCFCDRY